jgi:hypothetical protein
MSYLCIIIAGLFFLGGRRGMRTPKHFVNLTGESKNFKLLVFLLNKLQILSLAAFIFSDMNYKIVIFLSQTESTPKHFLRKKALNNNNNNNNCILLSKPIFYCACCYFNDKFYINFGGSLEY